MSIVYQQGAHHTPTFPKSAAANPASSNHAAEDEAAADRAVDEANVGHEADEGEEEEKEQYDSYWGPEVHDDSGEEAASVPMNVPAEAFAAASTAAVAAAAENESMADEEEGELVEVDPSEVPQVGDLTAAFFAEMSASRSNYQSNRKRKSRHHRDEEEPEIDSDEEYGLSQKRAFAIPQHIIANFDPTSTAAPQSAEEYLLRVRFEAEKCPSVKVSDIDPRAYEHKQTRYVPPLSKAHRPRNDKCMPSENWSQNFVHEFAEARQGLLRFATLNPHLRKGNAGNGVPHRRDFPAWINYCLGQVKPHTSGFSAVNAESPLPTFAASSSSSSSSPPAFTPQLPNLPSLPLLVAMDQVSCKGILTQLLTYGIEELDKRRKQMDGEQQQLENVTSAMLTANPFPSHAYSLWCYTLMLKIDKPITAALASEMRGLYRRLSWMRAIDNRPESETVKFCNMLLTLFEKQFGQKVELV